MIELFNKGKREIQCETGSFRPEEKKPFSEEESKRLMSLFPNEVIELSEIAIIDHSEEVKKELSEAREEISRLKKELSEKAKPRGRRKEK